MRRTGMTADRRERREGSGELLLLPFHFGVGPLQFYKQEVSLLPRGRLHRLAFHRGQSESENYFVAVVARLLRGIKLIVFCYRALRFPMIGRHGESAAVALVDVFTFQSGRLARR